MRRLNTDDKEETKRDRRERSWYGAVFLAAALYVCILAHEILSTILLSFFLILLISLALNPIVLRIRQKSGRRGVGVAIVVVVFLTVAGLAAVAFCAPLKTSGSRFVQQLAGYWQRVEGPLAKIDGQAATSSQKSKDKSVVQEAPAGQSTDRNSAQDSDVTPVGKSGSNAGVLQTSAREALGALLSSFRQFALNLASLLVVAVIVFFGTIFTLINPYPIIGFLFAILPQRHQDQAVVIFQRIAGFVPRWAMATALAMLVVGALVFLAMWPVFGFVDAVALGVIAAILEAIPYLGPILSSVPALLLAVGQGGLTPLWVVLIYMAVYSLEAYVIAPLIMADRLDVHPVAVIFSVFLCGAAFGVLGVLVAVPMLVIVQILYDELYRPRFLPNVSQRDLDQMAHVALQDKKK